MQKEFVNVKIVEYTRVQKVGIYAIVVDCMDNK